MLKGMITHILSKIKNVIKNYNDIEYINKNINSLISGMYCFNKIEYLINNKGKYLRSMLSLYYYDKYNNDKSYSIEELHRILAIVELAHFASLLHDDVIDNSVSRRSEKSLNYLYGNKNSILIGDYLLINIFNNLLQIVNNQNYSKYIINQFIKASTDTAYGAYLENNLSFTDLYSDKCVPIFHQSSNNLKQSNVKDYIRIAKLKTGSLFKFSCISGGVISNTNFHNIKQAANFGLIFGIIYQIQNDLDDYKCVNYTDSEDYMQSNVTFPIIILSNITDVISLFNNKNQKNFDKIKQLIDTDQFKNISNKIINPYINNIKSYI